MRVDSGLHPNDGLWSYCGGPARMILSFGSPTAPAFAAAPRSGADRLERRVVYRVAGDAFRRTAAQTGQRRLGPCRARLNFARLGNTPVRFIDVHRSLPDQPEITLWCKPAKGQLPDAQSPPSLPTAAEPVGLEA